MSNTSMPAGAPGRVGVSPYARFSRDPEAGLSPTSHELNALRPALLLMTCPSLKEIGCPRITELS
jgi:hypothetical protein